MSTSTQQHKQRLAAAARRRASELAEIKARGRAQSSRPGDVWVSRRLYEKIERAERLRSNLPADELQGDCRCRAQRFLRLHRAPAPDTAFVPSCLKK
jgi:hypothetical protein